MAPLRKHLTLVVGAAALSTAAFLPMQGGSLGAPPEPVQNPTTPEKAVLGKILFWEEQLSSDNTVA